MLSKKAVQFHKGWDKVDYKVRSLLHSFLLLTLFLCSCAVGPNYKRPPLDVPPNFRNAPTIPGTNSLAELAWWEVFKDPTLKQLVSLALTNNYDLRIAIARVEEAQAVAAQNRALFFPQLNYVGEVARGKNVASGNPAFNGGNTGNTFALTGNASWEADLWGRIRRLNEATRSQFFASQEAQTAVAISLISHVAQSYFRLLALDAQLEIARRSTNSFGESLRIFSQRFEQGVVSKLESAAAEAALASAAATVPEFERQAITQENVLAALLGHTPSPISRQGNLSEVDLTLKVPVGLPSELLRRRPDILEAEQLLRASNAQVGVAVANFFPQLSLTAVFGQVSPELAAFTSGGANAWSIAANLAGPIFQGGRLMNQYRQA